MPRRQRIADQRLTCRIGKLCPKIAARCPEGTSPAGGQYMPKNIVAVWIETSNGTFVKTIGCWADARRSHLVAWVAKAGTSLEIDRRPARALASRPVKPPRAGAW